jgi:hypothetical protein
VPTFWLTTNHLRFLVILITSLNHLIITSFCRPRSFLLTLPMIRLFRRFVGRVVLCLSLLCSGVLTLCGWCFFQSCFLWYSFCWCFCACVAFGFCGRRFRHAVLTLSKFATLYFPLCLVVYYVATHSQSLVM